MENKFTHKVKIFEPEEALALVYFSKTEEGNTIVGYKLFDDEGNAKHRLSKSLLRYPKLKNIPYFSILGRRVYITELSTLD